MCINNKQDKEFKTILDLLSSNKEASDIYLDICKKNKEIDYLLDKLKKESSNLPKENIDIIINSTFICDK